MGDVDISEYLDDFVLGFRDKGEPLDIYDNEYISVKFVHEHSFLPAKKKMRMLGCMIALQRVIFLEMECTNKKTLTRNLENCIALTHLQNMYQK